MTKPSITPLANYPHLYITTLLLRNEWSYNIILLHNSFVLIPLHMGHFCPQDHIIKHLALSAVITEIPIEIININIPST